MKVFLVAGEPSGDRLGAALMRGLTELVPGVTFLGVGGPEMAAQGLSSLFPMDELSVMGLAEVLPRYPQLKRRMHQTAQAVLDTGPDVLVTIDSPDFCLRVAKEVRKVRHVHTVHYVAPSVWAWRPGRATKMARHVDQVLALLPFEPPYLEAAGLRCDFVGHPVVAEPVVPERDARRFREEFGIGSAPLLLALPGSRRSEVQRLAPVFGQALGPLRDRHPDLRVVVPAAAAVAEQVADAIASWPGRAILLDPRDDPASAAVNKARAFAAADAALAASGTVSLELAAAGTPMVIAYDMNRLTWAIMRRMVRIDTVTLVNLVTDSRVVPEFLGPACQPEPIAEALGDLLRAPDLQTPALSRTMQALGRGGEAPGLRAARAILDGLTAGRGI